MVPASEAQSLQTVQYNAQKKPLKKKNTHGFPEPTGHFPASKQKP
jgi:hypothetical protein